LKKYGYFNGWILDIGFDLMLTKVTVLRIRQNNIIPPRRDIVLEAGGL